MLSEFERRVRTVEEEIRHQERERVYTLDVDGTIVFKSEGLERTVYIPEKLAKGRLVIHNHPNGESFSRADVQVFLRVGAAEFRVVTERYRFLLRIAGIVRWEDIEQVVGQLYFEEMEAAVLRYRQGVATVDEASRHVLHRVWERAAAALGWDYRREELER